MTRLLCLALCLAACDSAGSVAASDASGEVDGGVTDAAPADAAVDAAPPVVLRVMSLNSWNKGAEVVAASPTRLTVTVPSGAVSGPITVSTPSGAGSSPESFRVLGTLGISPASAVVAPGASVAFSASGDGIGPVRWSVDGLVGGDAARGTITSDGLYVAPQSLPPDGVRITATSVEDAALHASARVTMIPPRPVFLTTRADVSVAVARPITTFAAATPLTVAVAPVVLDVAPSEGVRGETVRITVRGVGVAGATGLQFFAGPSADTALAVADFSVDAESDTATADIAIAADAVPGPRLVRLVTPSGASAAAGFGDSLFTVR